jgi:hypothetical protein
MAERDQWDANAALTFWRDSMPDATPSQLSALVAGDRALLLLQRLDGYITASGDAVKLTNTANALELLIADLAATNQKGELKNED